MSNLNLLAATASSRPPSATSTWSTAPRCSISSATHRRAALPVVDVPTSTWFGSSSGPGFCFIVGHEVPFDQPTLPNLYPTHGTYVRDVIGDVLNLVEQRYLALANGGKLIHQPQTANIP